MAACTMLVRLRQSRQLVRTCAARARWRNGALCVRGAAQTVESPPRPQSLTCRGQRGIGSDCHATRSEHLCVSSAHVQAQRSEGRTRSAE
eukprot:6091218-Pleurochrysis_carterae.AAC.5